MSNIWLITFKGLSGSGKSTLGRALSKQLGWPLIDKDDGRKTFQLPAHHQTDWDAFKRIRQDKLSEGDYQIFDPFFIVDTARPFQECFIEVVDWVEQLLKSS